MTDLRSIAEADPIVAALLGDEADRQRGNIHLIASENFISRAVMQASGSILSNKYSEGYPGHRYYEGCEVVDRIENLARDRATALFGADHANVQSHSGAQANMAVYFGLLEPGDTVLGMALDQGGHLTHGSPVNFSGKIFDFHGYGVDPVTERVDMDEVRRKALEVRPKLIMAGYSAYSRLLDWEAFRAVADEVGAYLVVDTAHIIGLIAGGAHPDPVPHAHVVTGTTHKALRGPRGGLILCVEDLAEAIDKAVFPNTQGGPLNNQIAARAVAFAEASTPAYRDYARQVVRNAAAMAAAMTADGARIVSGGTDNHLFLVDLRSIDEDLTGREAARVLSSVGIVLNSNPIPFDPRPSYRATGIRIGTPAATTCGLQEADVEATGRLILEALRGRGDQVVLGSVAGRVAEITAAHPPYPPDFPGHV
ncbi:MAG: serine hydroxymethyltransferase [Actinomycetota bacterium]